MKKRAIVIGGGHNGLVAACLLKKNDIETTVLEAKNTVGGACRNSVFSAQSVNWGANHLFMLAEEVISSLNLYSDLNEMAFKFASKEADYIHIDRVKNCSDEEKHKLFNEEVTRAAKVFKEEMMKKNSSVECFRNRIKNLQLRSEDLFIDGSLLDVFNFYFGESSEITAEKISGKILSKYRVDKENTAISILYLACSNPRFEPWASSPYGMQSITDCLKEKFNSAGGKIITNQKIEKALWRNNLVSEVLTEDGISYVADYFLFSGSPLDFYNIFHKKDRTNFNKNFLKEWSNAEQDGGCSKMMISSRTPLTFKGAKSDALQSTMLVKGLKLDQWVQQFEYAAKNGHSNEPYFEVFGPSDFHHKDDDRYIYSIFIMYSSYTKLISMSKSDREDEKNKLKDYIISYIHNPDAVIDVETMDPVDLENEFGLRRGNVDHGRFTLDCILDRRRIDQQILDDVDANVVGCGSGFWAGGLVSGLPGLLAVEHLLKKNGVTT